MVTIALLCWDLICIAAAPSRALRPLGGALSAVTLWKPLSESQSQTLLLAHRPTFTLHIAHSLCPTSTNMQRSYRCNSAAPVRARPGPGARPAVETPLEQELRRSLQDVQRNLRGQISANQEQQHRVRDLQLLLKQRDSEIQGLRELNQQLLDDKTAIIEYGKQLWREREQEMAEAVASGLVQVKEHIDHLEEQNEEKDATIQALEEHMKNQAQRPRDDGTVQELESAYTTIQELEETLREKNYQLEMFHLELYKVSDDKERLQEQLEKLQAELQEAPKETESSQTLQEQQLRLEELKNTLEKKELELTEASEDRETIQQLREQLEMIKAERSRYEQQVNEEVQSSRTTIMEQRVCLENLNKALEQVKEEKLTFEGQLQEAEEKNRGTIQKLREQVERLQAEEETATQLKAQEAESRLKLLEKQKKLEETLKKKDVKLVEASEDKQTIERLRKQVEKVKAEEQALHTQRSSLESALAEQTQRAAEAETKAEELERNLETEQRNIQVLKREMESQKETFEEAFKGFYASYGNLMEDKKHQEEKVQELSAELQSCEEQRTSVLHRCEELKSRAEELQLAMDQTKQKKKKKRWFKLWH